MAALNAAGLVTYVQQRIDELVVDGRHVGDTELPTPVLPITAGVIEVRSHFMDDVSIPTGLKYLRIFIADANDALFSIDDQYVLVTIPELGVYNSRMLVYETYWSRERPGSMVIVLSNADGYTGGVINNDEGEWGDDEWMDDADTDVL